MATDLYGSDINLGYGKVNFFLDATDDTLMQDQVPAFDGGMFSNLRANLLAANQSKVLGNMRRG